MNLNQLLLWMVCLSSAALLARSSRSPQETARGWSIVSIAILAIAGLTFYWVPAWAGWISGSLWALLVIVPIVGLRRSNRLCFGERYDRASQWAKVLAWLHPTDGWVERVELLRAKATAQRGDFATAHQILERYRTLPTRIGRSATAAGYAIEANWNALLDWLRHSVSPKARANNWELTHDYLRALGETGDLNGLLEEAMRFELKASRSQLTPDDLFQLDRMRLYCWAFCGRVDRVQTILNSASKLYPPQTRAFWLATACMAAGGEDAAAATQQLVGLKERANGLLQRAIAWRLSVPLAAPQQVLQPSSQGILEYWETRQESSTTDRIRASQRIPWATYSAIAVNAILFAVETLLGGSQNNQVLYRLGALVPEVVWAGEWWRLLSATFLHFGIAHLGMNMLGLYILGIYVEVALGVWRYLALYLVSGTGSMLATTILSLWLEPDAGVRLVVGASGAVMGLIGAIAAILLRGWRQKKVRADRDRLRAILLIVGLQTIFDLMNPQICFVCHASGLILGFVTCSFFFWVEGIRNRDR
ncbi:MAG: rhomboid family intramembrane serine protease [Cyanobacteriota bacterium]|nr:rhomboid family intramembrane serine protease [Cyanobacteriota bacterium]